MKFASGVAAFSCLALTACIHAPLPFGGVDVPASQLDRTEQAQIEESIRREFSVDSNSQFKLLVRMRDIVRRPWLEAALISHGYLQQRSHRLQFNSKYGESCELEHETSSCRVFHVANIEFLKLLDLHRSDAAGDLGRRMNFTVRASPVGFLGNLLAEHGALDCQTQDNSNVWTGDKTVGEGSADAQEYGYPKISEISTACPQFFRNGT